MQGLVRLSGLSVALKVGRYALGIASAALMTRLMPIHEYGIYAYMLSIAALLAIPGEAGMPNLVMREIARARADSDQPTLRGIVLFANATVLICTIAIGALCTIVFLVANGSIPREFAYLIAAVFPALLFGGLANTRAGIQRGLGSPILSQLPEQILRPTALILFTLLAFILLGRPLRALDGLIVFALASAAAFLYGTILLHKIYREKAGTGPARFQARPWLMALLPFSAIAGLQIALVQISTIILGFSASPADIALLRIATLGSDLTLFSVLAINSVVAPQIAGHYHRGEIQELELLISRVNRLNVLFGLLVFVSLVAAGPLALRIGFGPQYQAAYLPMCILALGHLVATTIGYASTLANMAGRERLTIIAALFGFALNGALSLLLCPLFGALGAAIAASATAVAWRLLLAVLLRGKTGIRAWAFKWTLDRAEFRHLKL